MLDEATIERIVREVIRRLLEVNPALFYEAGAGDGSASEPSRSRAGTAAAGPVSSNLAMNPLGTSSVSFSGFGGPNAGFGRPSSGFANGPMGNGVAGRMPGFSGMVGAGSVASPVGRDLASHHHGRVLTEFDLILARRSGHRVLTLRRGTIVTPLAKDRAKDMGIELRYRD